MENFIDIQEASKLLGVHPVTLSKKAQDNKLPAYKRLNKWYFKKDELLAHVMKPNKKALAQ